MDRMGYMYYIQTNVTCMVILGLIYLRWLLNKSSHKTTMDMYFNRFTGSVFFMCVGDILAWCFIGDTSTATNVIMEFGNILYLTTIISAGYFWCSYVFLRLGLFERNYKRRSMFLRIPALLFLVVAVTNPFTNFLFTIQDGIYYRSSGIVVHWIVCWSYMCLAVAISVKAIVKEQNPNRRREYHPFILFIIAPFLASFAQIIWFGLSTTQVGMTVSIILVYLNFQEGLVNTDALTGLNIRRTLDRYFDNYLSRSSTHPLTVIMADINSFKSINDIYGHLEGDGALGYVSDALKDACSRIGHPSMLCRYGGDEFVVASIDLDEDKLEDFIATARANVAKISMENGLPYELSLSIGSYTAVCLDYEDINALVSQADKNMYANKAAIGSTRQ